ncbi:hypothetical protein Tco_1388590 [Tanacetum coccineum]
MVEEPLKMKKKDQISFDKQEAIRLQDEFDEEIDVDYQIAKQMQAEEQEELSIEEKLKLFVQLLETRKKHFATKRAEEKRNRPPTRPQQGSIISMKRINTFVDMDTKLVEEKAKKQTVDEDKEIAELQSLVEVIPDEEEVAIDAIPLATRPTSIVNWKILKERKISYYQIIRANGSSKRYSAFIQMLRSFDREDLETLWKLVKAKHGSTRPEEGYERVLWGDLRIMFEHHVEDIVWRNLQGNKVLIWKLCDSCGVHFVRFQDIHIFMLREKKYRLTPTTITEMLKKRLQADHWNEMCYQLLKLLTKQLKNQ